MNGMTQEHPIISVSEEEDEDIKQMVASLRIDDALHAHHERKARSHNLVCNALNEAAERMEDMAKDFGSVTRSFLEQSAKRCRAALKVAKEIEHK